MEWSQSYFMPLGVQVSLYSHQLKAKFDGSTARVLYPWEFKSSYTVIS